MNDKGDKYNRILKASIEVISEKGLHKTSISDIVKKAEVAQGTFYLYFSSKNALIPAIAKNLLTIILDNLKNQVNTDESFWQALQIYIDETFVLTDQYKDVLSLCYAGLAFDYSMETWEKIYEPFYLWFENLLIIAIERGEVDSLIPISWTTKLIINSVENAAERFYISKDQEMTCDDSKEALFCFIQRSLICK
ncbi:MAG: TetR family transcriptional regulator [Solibacillus sp.]